MKIKLFIVMCTCALASLLCSCGAIYNEELSPKLTSVLVWGENDGTENGQYLIAELKFDKDVALSENAAKQFRITVGGNRIQDSDTVVSCEGSIVALKMNERFATTGQLMIEPADLKKGITAITDESGKYALGGLKIEKIIPSGVTIEKLEQTGSSSSFAVASLWSHRGILWVQVYLDGELLEPEAANGTEILDGAAAVHGHNFNSDIAEDIAANLTEVLNNYFGSWLYAGNVSSDGSFNVELINGTTGDLEIREYIGLEETTWAE